MKITKIVSVCAAICIVMGAAGNLAASDIKKGKKIAKKCKMCHTLNEGGKNKLGPNLFGIMGKPAGAVEGYKYSKALLASGITWDGVTFSAFMAKPKKVIKGTKMSFSGIKKASQRADLLAYFQTLQNGPNTQVAVGNPEDGKRFAAKSCVVCHSFEKGGKLVFGPNLFDIAGKPAGAIKGYKYSDAMKSSSLTWTDKNLLDFMANPEQFLKGTTARFPGLKSAKQRADILAYLKTFK